MCKGVKGDALPDRGMSGGVFFMGDLRNILRVGGGKCSFSYVGSCVIYYGFRKPQVSLRGATFVAKVAKTGGISGYPPKPPSTAEG